MSFIGYNAVSSPSRGVHGAQGTLSLDCFVMLTRAVFVIYTCTVAALLLGSSEQLFDIDAIARAWRQRDGCVGCSGQPGLRRLGGGGGLRGEAGGEAALRYRGGGPVRSTETSML